MAEAEQVEHQEESLLAEIASLRQELDRLRRENSDLEIALQTTAEHGDIMEADLHETNQRLQNEIAERRLAQSTLQEIFEKVSRDKQDLEMILQVTAEHGDMLEYRLYTKAVEAMRQSEELFRAIAESTPILMILTNRPDGSIVYANSTSSARLGLETRQIIGHKLWEFFANPMDEATLLTMLADEGTVRNYELQAKRADGSLFWVSASMHMMMFSGKPTLLTTLYDISDRKDAEEALRQSELQLREQAQQLELRVEQRTAELRKAEEMYRSIFENAVEGIYQVTADGSFLSANPAMAEILGYESAEELIATVTDIGHQLYAQPRRREELVAYMRRYDAVSGFESQVYQKDGSVIWISENIRAVYSAIGNLLHYEGTVQDVTARKSTEAELYQQRRMTERLLLNVLPQPIAERLKRGQKTIADSFPEASVLFADLVNFTQLSSHISPVELVELLSNIFSAFDTLADRYKLEKIKTIGDAYMVVGGLPQPRLDHIWAIADMALDMQREIHRFRMKQGEPITLRVGIHSGPVVAGVIGTKKFIYDLWGDTVNIASRMESQGESGRIQVTAEIYERLKKRYEFEARGCIDIKGKGAMDTYWLLGKKTEVD